MKKPPTRATKTRVAAAPAPAPAAAPGPTTRKTIEVPADYFYWVKLTAVKRRMKEKDLWAEILREYFTRHPVK
jgi:cell division septation protein DedD